MTSHHRTLFILFGISAVFIAAILLLRPAKYDGKTHIFMLNIGQGDSFLIEAANGKKIMIDGGRDTTVLSELSKVLPVGDQNIDIMIATHPDADHIGGLQYVLDRYQVGLFLTSDAQTDTKTFTDLYKVLLKEHIPCYYVRHGMVITLDTAPLTTLSILFPDRDTSTWQTNPASVVARLHVGSSDSGRSALFTGDSTSPVEHFLVQAESQSLTSDVLKLGHHGSKFSSSTEYLKAVSPALGLISAGIDNKYGHPNQETLGRLQDLAIPWISTQQKGTVDLTTDGTTQWTWRSVQ